MRRLLSKMQSPILALGIAGAVLIATIAQAGAFFIVNTLSDSHDVHRGDFICADGSGGCSLRAAIEESNGVFDFHPPNGHDLILVPSGTYRLSMGPLYITSSLSLWGAGSNSTFIDGNQRTDIFSISDIWGTNPIVDMSGLTIKNGWGGINFGTGIRVAKGSTLNLSYSTVSGNIARVGGVGIANFGGYVDLFRSTVEGNEIIGGGGGITGTGAGIYNTRGSTFIMNESTISNNRGIRGGGISNAGTLKIVNSTISGNSASTGGGIRNTSTGEVYISSSTITGNQAGLVTGEPKQNRVGGGISNLQGRVIMGNSILAGNTDMRSRSDPLFSPDCFSVNEFGFHSNSHNVVGIINMNCNLNDRIAPPLDFDQVGTPNAPLDPLLGPLANNGGPTQTHALLPGSPAIDQGGILLCPETDQRGAGRPVGMKCDVGAFEFGSTVPVAEPSSVALLAAGLAILALSRRRPTHS